MDYSFKFKGFQVVAPKHEVQMKLDEIEYSVTNANVLEIAQASAQLVDVFIKATKEFKEIVDVADAQKEEKALTSSISFPQQVGELVQGDTVYTDDDKTGILLGLNEEDGTAYVRIEGADSAFYTLTYFIDEVSLTPFKSETPSI